VRAAEVTRLALYQKLGSFGAVAEAVIRAFEQAGHDQRVEQPR
jgi:hypothetical protein